MLKKMIEKLCSECGIVFEPDKSKTVCNTCHDMDEYVTMRMNRFAKLL